MTEEKKVEEKKAAQEPVRETASEIARRLGIAMPLAKLYHEISPLFENTSVTIKKDGTHRFVVYLRDEINIQCLYVDSNIPYCVYLMRGTKYLPGLGRFVRIAYGAAVERIKKYAQMYM